MDVSVELDQDVFDVLMEKAARYALIVSDGTVDSVQAILREHGVDMSPVARKRLAAHIIEHGPTHEQDQQSWAQTLRELQPRRATT
jgi:hypothetical protein